MGGHASISALVDDEHGYVSSDVEADNKDPAWKESVLPFLPASETPCIS